MSHPIATGAARPRDDTEMNHYEGTFRGAGGLPLYWQSWRKAGRPVGTVVNVHGLGDHGGLYPTLVEHLVGRGWAVYGFDLRGNGRSPGQRAYIESWDEYREDLRAFIAEVRSREPDTPMFVVGTSLGGLIVLDFALHDPGPLCGVVAAAAPLGPLGVPPALMLLGRVLSRVWPRFSLEVGMDLTGLARDPAVAATILGDPLFHRAGTARLSTEVTAAIARVRARAGELALPLLLIHGGADRMVPPAGTRELYHLAGSPDKTYLEYPESYHAIFADLDRDRVLDDLERWLRRHVGNCPGTASGSRE